MFNIIESKNQRNEVPFPPKNFKSRRKKVHNNSNKRWKSTTEKFDGNRTTTFQFPHSTAVGQRRDYAHWIAKVKTPVNSRIKIEYIIKTNSLNRSEETLENKTSPNWTTNQQLKHTKNEEEKVETSGFVWKHNQ